MVRSASCAALVALVLTILSGNQLACSSSSAAKTCSSSEESACTNAYTDCSTKAAAAADRVACQKCVDTYCSCYSACGNTCDKQKLTAACQ